MDDDACIRCVKNWLLKGFLVDDTSDSARQDHLDYDPRILIYHTDEEIDQALRDLGFEP